jgi:hypothetical protein
MKRECEILKKEWLKGIRINDPGKKISVYYDCKNEDEIEALFKDQKLKKRMKVVLTYVLNGIYFDDFYSFEEVSSKAKSVTAMKIKLKGYANIRVVCKEFFKNGKKIVVVTIVDKKTQKVNKKLKELYERVGGYEYEFKD